MEGSPDFLDIPLRELLDEVSSPRAVPGGGAVLGMTLAMAAGTLGMAARFSRESWSEAAGAAAQADALRDRAARLARVDADTYEQALVARDTASELPADRRDWEIGRAFAKAAEPPLALAELAANVAELAREVARCGDQRVRVDALAAAALASAAARAAVEIVAVNLTATEDDERVTRARDLAESAEGCAKLAFRGD